ncbi:hypothetical protein C0Q70_16462 [Pomacea canaliculata]|uniref:Uncharacterized protein n=1 Tax=Pomacea canaliculata TaxID=400727 RepID=A0A2T7NPV0_POMCA|nr:hypothetical protein C0Q70_16462 [Pomacea canaliculata]
MARKNRCNCFDEEINAVLTGLRREGPSTERSILERLVNLLSRAAVKDRGEVNPQKVWTKELEPVWWKEFTDLRWKNPREHPKDRKDDLKKKVNILHNRLTELGGMTTVLEEEFQLATNSNKADIELKSDFEAIIAKVSGLHFMLENVSKKLKAAKDFTEKIAHYVRKISSCFEKCQLVVQETTLIVEAKDKKKDQLWQSMGVERPGTQQVGFKKKSSDPIFSIEKILESEEFLCMFDSSPEPSPGVDTEEILFRFQTDDISEDNTLPKSSTQTRRPILPK